MSLAWHTIFSSLPCIDRGAVSCRETISHMQYKIYRFELVVRISFGLADLSIIAGIVFKLTGISLFGLDPYSDFVFSTQSFLYAFAINVTQIAFLMRKQHRYKTYRTQPGTSRRETIESDTLIIHGRKIRNGCFFYYWRV